MRGQFQPLILLTSFTDTIELYGGSAYNLVLIRLKTFLASAVGPTLTEHLAFIFGCIKFPAPYAGGRPEIPVIVNCDICDLFNRF